MHGAGVVGTTLDTLFRGKARLGAPGIATTRFGVILLVLTCVGATLAMAVFLLVRQAASQRAELEEDAEAAARSTALMIDAQLGAAEALLTGLAVSHHLDTGDLAAFQDQAVQLRKPPGSRIILLDPEGRMLVNTMRAYGAPLPEIGDANKQLLAAMVESRSTRVTNLARSLLSDDYGAAVGVPVIRNDKVVYVLAIALVGEALTRDLDHSSLPAGWSAAVLDRLGATIMRYPAEAHDLDGVDAPALLARARGEGERGFDITTSTHELIFIAHAPSKLAGWTAVVAVPGVLLTQPMHRAIGLISGGGGAIFLMAAGIALVASSRIDRPFRQRMEASEGRFRGMAETVPNILFAVGPNGECEYVNQRFYEYTGMAPGSALGFGWTAALHPDDQEQARETLRQPIGEGEILLREVRFRAKDGGYRWFLSRVRPVQDSGGRIVKWFGSSTDIDAIKQSDTMMRRINERLTAVLSSINECYFTVDHQWRITYVNPNAATYFREDPARLVGRTLWEVSPHVIGTELEKQLRVALEGHMPLHVERVSREYPGRWFQISCYPWPEGLSIFFSDITRRKAAELAARDTQELLQLTMDALSARIAILDERGVIMRVNAAWRRSDDGNGFFGGAHGVGSDFAVCAAAIPEPSQRQQAEKGVRALLHGEAQEFRMEYAVPAPNTPKWFQLRATRFGADGARRVVIAQEDITEIKQAEHGLRELAGRLLRLQDEERRRMARDLHDTTAQNLVAAILDVDRLHQTASELGDVSEELLDEARALIEQSLQEIRTLSYLLHPPLLDELGLASALSWYVRGFESRSGITVAVAIDEGMERLPAAVEQALFRIVQEALTNIHRHSGSATAEIRLSGSASEVVLEITDQGRGMPAEGGSDRSNIASLGVGVSGMRARLQQLGGELTIRGTGRGTTVTATVSLDRLRSISAER